MKVGRRLTLGFAVVVACVFAAITLSLSLSGTIYEKFSLLEEDIVPGAIAMADMDGEALYVTHGLMEYILHGQAETRENIETAMRLLNEAGLEHAKHEIHTGTEERKAAQKILSAIDRFASVVEETIAFKDAGAGLDELLEMEQRDVHFAVEPLMELLRRHKAVHLEDLAAAEEAVGKAHTLLVRTSVIAGGIIAALAVITAFAATRSIVKPLHALHKGTETIGLGDLDYKVATDAKDEIGQLSRAFDEMTENLKHTTTSIAGLEQEVDRRRRTEEQLQQSEERFQLALKGADLGTWDSNIQTGSVVVNKRWAQMLGYELEEIAQDTGSWEKLVHPDDMPIVNEKWNAHLEGRTSFYEAEMRMKSKSGRWIWIADRGKVFEWDKAGNPLRALGTHLDITERKAAEEKYRTLFESSRDAIMMLAPPTWRFTAGNDATVKIFGAGSEDEFTSKGPWDVSPEYQPDGQLSEDKAKKMIEKAMNEGSNFFEWTHKRFNGEEFPTTVLLTRLELAGSKLLQATVRDITVQKGAEEAQVRLLEQIQSVNDELKDFAYVVSHDLKAPLRGIKALTQWLSTDYSDKFDEEGAEQMALLVNRVDRMHNLIDGILQYSRVGRVVEEQEEIDLNELLPGVIDMVSAPENIEITADENLPTITCERTRITQIFENLLSNAVKFMDKSEGRIHIGCGDDGDFRRFSVADNGPGIERQHFERIFRMFQTLQSRDKFESTGVGLTLVKKIVERYGGKIWVESEQGKGATFFFTLPKQIVVQPAEQTGSAEIASAIS